MRTQDVTEGLVVKTKSGVQGLVLVARKAETGKKGRPTTFFTVQGADGEFRAKDLRKAGQLSDPKSV